MLPSFHYWSWNTEGNVLGQIRTYWWPEHTLHKLGFDAFNPLEKVKSKLIQLRPIQFNYTDQQLK
jgi:hypothetical protein